MSKMHVRLVVGLFGALQLGACGPAKPVNPLRDAFDAAARDDAEAFAEVVAPGATLTFMNAYPRRLRPDVLRKRLSRGCRLTDFREIRVDIVSARGSCDQKTPYGDNLPVFFQAYLRDGKIVRVDQMVYPL